MLRHSILMALWTNPCKPSGRSVMYRQAALSLPSRWCEFHWTIVVCMLFGWRRRMCSCASSPQSVKHQAQNPHMHVLEEQVKAQQPSKLSNAAPHRGHLRVKMFSTMCRRCLSTSLSCSSPCLYSSTSVAFCSPSFACFSFRNRTKLFCSWVGFQLARQLCLSI